MRGRRRKPTHLKIVAGNPGKRPLNLNEPDPVGDRPVAPAYLNARAKGIFARLVELLEEMNCGSASYADTLAMAALRIDEVHKMTTEIAKLGYTYTTTTKTGDVMVRSRPEVAIRNEAARHAHSLLSSMGLTPTDISKVTAKPKEKKSGFAAI